MENIIIDPRNNKIKLIDFGFSCYYKEGEKLSDRVGTPYYTAPEVLKNEGYGQECDMWSIGVIAYILLTGSPPFYAKKPVDICKKILTSSVRYDDSEWDDLSNTARRFVRAVLVKDPEKRLTPEQALKTDWICQKMERNPEISARVIKRLVEIRQIDDMKKEFFIILFNQMNSEKKKKYSDIFEKLDVDEEGNIKI